MVRVPPVSGPTFGCIETCKVSSNVIAAAYTEMGYMKVEYSIFKLEALQAQEKLIAKRTGGKMTSWTKCCNICGGGVPVDNHMEGVGSLLAEKEEEEEAKRPQKKARASTKPEAVPASTKPAATVTEAEHGKKGARSPPGKERKHSRVNISRGTNLCLAQ